MQLLPKSSWALAWPDEPFNQNDKRWRLVTELLVYLDSSVAWDDFLCMASSQIDGSCIIPISFSEFKAACGVQNLEPAFTHEPVAAMKCLSVACHEALTKAHKSKFNLVGIQRHQETSLPLIRLYGFDIETPLRQIKGSMIGKVLAVRGTVVRMGASHPLATLMDFACNKCGQRVRLDLPEGKFNYPQQCSSKGCRSKAFTPIRSSTRCKDWRTVRIQEIVGASKQQAGQVPRTLEVELWGSDLVNSCSVGDQVVVTGYVKVLATGEDLGKLGNGRGQKQDMFLLYLDAISVENKKPSHEPKPAPAPGPAPAPAPIQQPTLKPPGTRNEQHMTFSPKDLEFISKFTQENDGSQLGILSQSLCPTIYGHEIVKAGLLLALVGGIQGGKGKRSAADFPSQIKQTRGDIHALIVGDPGLGKSQLLQAAAAVSPRGVYVCGKTATAQGLTVSVVRDSLTGDFAFEAGPVLLSDRGACCIDEFDKTGAKEHQALLEAMEQQEVSVAKAGMVASLPARTSILAAANPAEGHYNRGKSVAENIKMSPAMLSRFDLIFILMDRPDDLTDQLVSKHVLAMHSGISQSSSFSQGRHFPQPSSSGRQPASSGQAANRSSILGDGSGRAFSDRVIQQARDADLNDEPVILPHQLIRKYIAYARQYVHPTLSDEAKEALLTFYLYLREQAAPGSTTPVTARQLESLIRLAVARARIDLRELVTRQDADDVINLMKEALYDRFMDDLACVDFRRGGGAGSKAGSKAAESNRFMAAIKRASARMGDSASFESGELLSIASEIGLQVKDVTVLVEQLNNAGELLQAGNGRYRLPRGGGVSVGGRHQSSDASRY